MQYVALLCTKREVWINNNTDDKKYKMQKIDDDDNNNRTAITWRVDSECNGIVHTFHGIFIIWQQRKKTKQFSRICTAHK